MKLFKADSKLWTVREVEGEPWPGRDSDGDQCFINTHFATSEEAWEKLESEASAWVELAARAVTRAREDVLTRERDAANAAVAFEKVRSSRPQQPE